MNGFSYHRKKFVADASGAIYLTGATLGAPLESMCALLLQGDAAFTVKVRAGADAPWAAYPGDGSSAAGEPLLIRGRWFELKVEIANTQTLWFHGDAIPLAWN